MVLGFRIRLKALDLMLKALDYRLSTKGSCFMALDFVLEVL